VDNPGDEKADTVASVAPTTGLVEGDTVTVEYYREAEPTSEPPSSDPGPPTPSDTGTPSAGDSATPSASAAGPPSTPSGTTSASAGSAPASVSRSGGAR